MHNRPAGAELAEAEAPHTARELRRGDRRGDRALDAGARSVRAVPLLGRVTQRFSVVAHRRLPAHGGTARWLRRGLRDDAAAVAATRHRRATSWGRYLLRARRRE